MTALPSQPTTASERDQIVARLSDLQAKQEAATGWGAAVGAREEEIRSLESRLLRIDSMTAPPSTETPRNTSSALTVTRGQPYCAWCNRIGHPATVECQRAYYAGQERKEFTARMMSNLDGEKDAQIATLTSSLAAAARIGELEKQIRAALKIVGDPASGHRMMSGRRDACAVWKLLSAALSQTEEGQS